MRSDCLRASDCFRVGSDCLQDISDCLRVRSEARRGRSNCLGRNDECRAEREVVGDGAGVGGGVRERGGVVGWVASAVIEGETGERAFVNGDKLLDGVVGELGSR